MNLGIKSGMKTRANMHMHMKTKSNYKFALKNHVEKNHKKFETKSAAKSNAKSNNKITELNKMTSKILFRGWMKYFKLPDDETSRKPKNFFKNPLFERDSKRKHAVGEDKIPSEKQFYAILFQDHLNIYTQNNKATIQHSYDVLTIDYIRSIPENEQKKGGVRDFGKFNEGYCFQVKTIIPKDVFKMTNAEYDPKEGTKEKWLICLDTDQQKQSLMNLLIKNKIQRQRDAGVILNGNTPTKTLSPSNPAGAFNTVEGLQQEESHGRKVDGRWVVLQDWSQCSLACGGGTQTLHLMCHPPQNGGRPCTGLNIRKRPCNPQPCPNIKQSEAPIKFEKPIVRMMPLTKRPTRYDKCNLKEQDIFAILKPDGINLSEQISLDPNYMMTDAAQKIPARVVMTQKSISVFRNENLDSIVFAGDLMNVSFMKIDKSKTCVILQGKNVSQQIIICSMESKDSFVDEWDYDFSLFKHQCQEKRPVVKNEEDDKRKFKEGVQNLKTSIIEDRTRKARENSQKDEELQMKKQVDNTQSMTFLAMQKEQRLEQLLQKEEEMREKEDEKMLDSQLEQEERKKKILMKSIKEKELEEQFNVSRENAKLAINKIKDEAKNQIIQKRAEIKKRINMMRLKSDRKKASIKSKIMSMRTDTANQLQMYAKKGNKDKCFIPDPNKEEDIHNMEVYCVANFPTQMNEFMECKIPESFCYSCCYREFGPMQFMLREKCLQERCKSTAV